MYQRSLILCALVLAVAAPAAADTFDVALAKAHEIGVSDLSSLLWARTGGGCSDARDDADRLACREVAAAVAGDTAGKLYYMQLTPKITAGAYNKRKRSLPLEAGSCLLCDGLDIDGKTTWVVGRVDPSKGLGPLRRTTMVFKSRDEAKRFVTKSLPRLVGEFLFTVPGEIGRFKQGNDEGVYIEVVSYRIYDPCTGEIALSKPKLADVQPEPKACAKAPKAPEAPKAPAPSGE